MIIKNLKISIRGIFKNKTQSVISIFGLGIGLGCVFLLALLYIHENSFDRYMPNHQQLYRVIRGTDCRTSFPLAKIAKDEIPLIDGYFRFYQTQELEIKNKNNEIFKDERLACADASVASTHKPLRFENKTPWDNIHYTGVSHLVVLEENATFLLQQGDVIGAFTYLGLCTGIVNIVPGTAAGLNIFGDDITTSAVDGHTDGEPLYFKLFRPGCATEFELDVVYDPSSQNTDGLFSLHGMSVISDLTMNASDVTAHSLSKLNIYPNPSKGIFNIAGIGLNQDIELVVFNIHGQVVYEEKPIKSHKINLSHQARGVYYIKFINDTVLKIEKVIVE